jgi:hypothetical protein
MCHFFCNQWCDQVGSRLFNDFSGIAGVWFFLTGIWHFFAGVLRVILDMFERQNLKIQLHVMQKPCSLQHPKLIGFRWISRNCSQIRSFDQFDDQSWSTMIQQKVNTVCIISVPYDLKKVLELYMTSSNLALLGLQRTNGSHTPIESD